jgi:tetratricopeptide (TPR) repeat protein
MASIRELLANGLRAHQAGRLSEAKQWYRQILQADSNQAEAHHLLGVAANQSGRHAEAIASIERAIELNPREAVYRANLGVSYEAAGRPAEAVASYQEALRLQPDYAEAHNNLGNALSTQGKLEVAIEHYRRALQLQPDFTEAHNGIGNALVGIGSSEEAVMHFEHALKQRQDYPEGHTGLGNALLSLGKLDEAVKHFGRALQLRPNFAEAHCNLGNALLVQDKTPEAVISYRNALRLRPRFAEACNSLGIALQRQEKLDEAFACIQNALQFKPHYSEAYTNLGNVQRDLGRFEEALASYEQALKLEPDLAETHHNRALLWLLQGNWSSGWPEYEWRLRTKGLSRFAPEEKRWDGSPLQERTLVVTAEQGLGDTLQFIRYVPLVQRQRGRIILQCQPPLRQLLTECWGMADIVTLDSPAPRFDVWAPLQSLPNILGTASKVPAKIPYLQARPDLVRGWERKMSGVRCPVSGVRNGFLDSGLRAPDSGHSSDTGLRTPDSGRILVGVAWQGRTAYREDRRRSVPLACFARLALVPGVRLVSLQKKSDVRCPVSDVGRVSGVRCPESGVQESVFDSGRRTPDSGHSWTVFDLGDELDRASGAFMDTAAVMKNLNLVICSDSAIAHLAGALGVAVWVAVPVVPDWRWQLQRTDSPWYPSMRLFRQTKAGTWDDVFDRMAEELAQGHG